MHIIVGIDGGENSAIACLDLNGKLLYAAHKRFAGYGWIISEINKVGTPSIIATDKKFAGKIVKKVNASFNSRIFCPDKDLGSEEKRMLAKNKGIKNHHEQDAYAAAVKAYNSYSNKLNQVSSMIKEPEIDKDKIRAKIINKVSVNEALLNKRTNRK